MEMKRRWISLFVENEVGTLARISGLFSGKSYNLDSLTVGQSEDPTVSRMTISLTSDDQTFEQIKKQLNRSIEVIKVIDFTDQPIHMKELLFIKITNCTKQELSEIIQISKILGIKTIDYSPSAILLESLKTEQQGNDLIALMAKSYPNRLEIVRGGSVAIDALSISNR